MPLLFYRCRFVQYSIYALAMVSIYTLVLMSLDRFLAVVYAVESMTWRLLQYEMAPGAAGAADNHTMHVVDGRPRGAAS